MYLINVINKHEICEIIMFNYLDGLICNASKVDKESMPRVPI